MENTTETINIYLEKEDGSRVQITEERANALLNKNNTRTPIEATRFFTMFPSAVQLVPENDVRDIIKPSFIQKNSILKTITGLFR